MSDYENDIKLRTDHYFKLTKKIVEKHGDIEVTYAVFMRRPVIYCPKLAIDWISSVVDSRGYKIKINECFEEGAWVGAGECLMYISGKLSILADLETIYLQKLGGACVAACKNSSAMLFTSAKVAHLSLLPQGQKEAKQRVTNMVATMDEAGFGSCTNTGACSAECPKEISQTNIARLNREFVKAQLGSFIKKK